MKIIVRSLKIDRRFGIFDFFPNNHNGDQVMLLKEGDKVHILIRRNFEKDIRRHLIGTVAGATDSVILVHGRKAVYNGPKANYSILPDYVSQVVSLVDNGNIVSLLPRELDIDSLSYEAEPGKTTLTDGKGFVLRINETGIIS